MIGPFFMRFGWVLLAAAVAGAGTPAVPAMAQQPANAPPGLFNGPVAGSVVESAFGSVPSGSDERNEAAENGDEATRKAAPAEAIVPGPAQRASEPVQAVSRTIPGAPIDAPLPLRRTFDPDADPDAPLGIRAGSFILYPSLTLSGGYTSNATGAAGGTAGGLGIVAGELLMRSDWSRHEASLALRGSYEAYTNGADPDPFAEANVHLGLDLADRWAANLDGSYLYTTESASDPNSPQGVDREPGYSVYGGRASLKGAFGAQVFTLTGFLDRSIYDNAVAGNVVIDQGDRNNTLYGGRLRLGYEVTPTFGPFVEGDLTRRDYDDPVDDDGIARSSRGWGLRAGFAFDRSPVSGGEIAVGYGQVKLGDPAMGKLSGLTVDGSLTWSPTPLVRATAAVLTSFSPSTNPSSSGSIVYDGSVNVAYLYRDNLTFNAVAGALNERYQGIGRNDWTYRLGVAATWHLRRGVSAVASYTHEWLDSSEPANNYVVDTLRVDLKLAP